MGSLRAKFYCDAGVTNVWRAPQVAGAERIQGARNGMRYKFSSLHGSQKPLVFIERIVGACTDRDDVVWEPFGGLCPGAVVCEKMKRQYFAAEIVPEFFVAATKRLKDSNGQTNANGATTHTTNGMEAFRLVAEGSGRHSRRS
jgi:site-specific DNA-methyltransferase (adenine-specific)